MNLYKTSRLSILKRIKALPKLFGENSVTTSFTNRQGDRTYLIFPCGMSRSGTTLLTTVLDSHSEIGLGYELIPPPLLNIASLLKFVERCVSQGIKSVDEVGQQLKSQGQKNERLFLVRCHRAGLSVSQTKMVLADLCKNGVRIVESLTDRLLVAERIAKAKQRQQNTRFYGFKLNSPAFNEAYKLFPQSYFFYIVRDPRDVVVSHRKRGFVRSTEQICKAWNNYLEKFESFYDDNSEIALIVRYEDLVMQPNDTLSRIFQVLPVDLEENVFRFYESVASVHGSHHPNAQALKQNFFTSSIGCWHSELEKGEWKKIQMLCRAGMKRQCYKLED